MKTIKNWNDQVIPVIRSAGGVLATYNPFDNLIHDNIFSFPTPEIVQKLYKSRQERAFNEDIKSSIGYYTDLQSLNGEDVITWSVFGTLMYSDSRSIINFTKKLFSILQLDSTFTAVNVWLWRRIPHPDTGVSGVRKLILLYKQRIPSYWEKQNGYLRLGRCKEKNKTKTKLI